MKRLFRLFSIALCLLCAPVGVSAQELVFHHCGGGETVVPMPATWSLVDGKIVVTGGGASVEIAKSEALTVTYRAAQGDVNGDERVDIGDVATILGLIANGGGQGSATDNAPAGAVAVDLGLPSGTKWANMNVGAQKPEDYGDYFAWGETKPKDVYNWDTYAYWQDTNGDGSVSSGEIANIGSDIAGTEYDAARANWGGQWKMPTREQCKELIDNCTSEWTEQGGVKGRKFTASNGNSIFLPAAGGVWVGQLDRVGSLGHYWSSTPNGELGGYELNFDSSNAFWDISYDRDNGQSVRPVR